MFWGDTAKMLLDISFFAICYAPGPCLLLKFRHMIDITCIFHVSKFQQQTRSRNKTSGKKLLPETAKPVPVIGLAETEMT